MYYITETKCYNLSIFIEYEINLQYNTMVLLLPTNKYVKLVFNSSRSLSIFINDLLSNLRHRITPENFNSYGILTINFP
jgi:hypothetical protein